MDQPWSFEHSVECPVAVSFAWKFWTTVDNWRLDSDVESVVLDGPFETGSRGATVSRRSGRVEWRIASVTGMEAVIEVPVGSAAALFRWRFEDVSRPHPDHATGERGGAKGLSSLAAQIAPMFEANIPAGMQKLCEAMTRAGLPAVL